MFPFQIQFHAPSLAPPFPRNLVLGLQELRAATPLPTLRKNEGKIRVQDKPSWAQVGDSLSLWGPQAQSAPLCSSGGEKGGGLSPALSAPLTLQAASPFPGGLLQPAQHLN